MCVRAGNIGLRLWSERLSVCVCVHVCLSVCTRCTTCVYVIFFLSVCVCVCACEFSEGLLGFLLSHIVNPAL